MSLPPKDNYAGEPDYPAPWTTKAPREGLRDTDEALIVSLSPDVCLTPVGSAVVPIPYPIVDFCGHDENYTPSVRFTGRKAMVMRSNTAHVHGDAPGTKKGICSGTVGGISEPVGHASQVRAEGSCVIRHLDRFKMNNGNTDGEAIFVKNTATHPAPEDDDPVPGSLRRIEAKDANKVAPTLGFLAPAAAKAIEAAGMGEAATGAAATAAEGAAATGIGTTLAGIGIFAAGVLFPTNKMNFSDIVPQDDYEQALLRDANQKIGDLHFWDNGSEIRDETIAKIRQHRQAKKKTAPETKPAPVAAPDDSNVRVSQEEYRKKCQVDKYSKMKNICGQYGMQAHHIVPDWTLRTGARSRVNERIPNMPSLNDGQAICVMGNAASQGTEHNQAHFADGAIETLGEHSTPLYTATLAQVRNESVNAMIKVRPDCAREIVEAVGKQFAGNNPNQLLRAKRFPPLPEETIKALKSGTIRSLP